MNILQKVPENNDIKQRVLKVIQFIGETDIAISSYPKILQLMKELFPEIA